MIVDNLQKEVEKVALIMHEINKKITQSPEFRRKYDSCDILME